MAIRTKFEITVQLSEDAQEGKELGNASPWRGTSDLQDNGGTFLQRVAAGATDVLVDLNGLSNGTLLAIKSNQEISIKKNSTGGEAWTVKPLGTGALNGVFVITTTGVTSLYVTNAGITNADVTFIFAGAA